MSLSEFESRFFNHRQEGENKDITVVEIVMSHITDEDNIQVFGDDLLSLVDQYNCNRIVVDAEKIEYVTSSVLGKFITLHRRLHRGDGKTVMCRVGESFMDVLKTSRLHSYFVIADNVEEAIKKIDE